MKFLHFRASLIVLLLLSQLNAALAQDSLGVIKGVVHGDNNLSLLGAYVVLRKL